MAKTDDDAQDNLVKAAEITEEQEAGDKPEEGQAEEPKEEAKAETPEEPKPEQPTEEAPAPSQDEAPSEAKAEPEPPKLSRRERREQRRREHQSLTEAIRRDQPQRTPLPEVPKYEPLDLSNPAKYSNEEGYVKTDVITEDRQKHGEARYQEGLRQAAELERWTADQEKFSERLELENEIVRTKYPFLDEDSPDFDEERADDLNQLFLELAQYRTDPQGRTMFGRTDLSYKKFVENELKRQARYAEQAAETSTKNVAAAKSNQGVRPSSGTQKGPKIATAADIRKLSPEQLEKYEDQINARATQLLGE